MFFTRLVEFYSYIVLGSVVISWVNLPRNNPIVQILETLTEPLLNPIRKALPSSGGLDFSPLVLLILLQMLARALH